jgi:two-component system, chemotaxis family, response regulator PixG
MTAVFIAQETISATLLAVSHSRGTGELTFREHPTPGREPWQWRLYFFYGRLIYASGDFHRVRRWQRVFQQHCPTFRLTHLPQAEHWEYHILSQAVTDGQVSIIQARKILKSSLEEVLFFLLNSPGLTSEWQPMPRFSLQETVGLGLLLSLPQLELALHQANRLCHQWHEFGLDRFHPYLSPRLTEMVKQTDSGLPLPKSLSKFLTGRKYTLWDLAAHTRCSVATLVRFLLPWMQQGAIALQSIPDLNLEIKLGSASPMAPRPRKFLIACIDDSPTVGRVLETILVPAGYRLLNIHDSLTGIATLVKYQPDLIFLDLIMPNTTGYNVCRFLRRTEAFQNTPIIILTSHDGLIDRTRAKLAGASDFMSKPPDPEAMLSLIQRYLVPANAPIPEEQVEIKR